jgi:hypothetical protein
MSSYKGSNIIESNDLYLDPGLIKVQGVKEVQSIYQCVFIFGNIPRLGLNNKFSNYILVWIYSNNGDY